MADEGGGGGGTFKCFELFMRVSRNMRVRIGNKTCKNAAINGNSGIMRGSECVSCLATSRIVGSSTSNGVCRAAIVVVLDHTSMVS